MNGLAVDGESISRELLDSIATSTLPDVAIDLAEAGLDAVLEEGIVSEIPVIRTLLGIGRTYQNITNRIFAKKILGFLAPIAECDEGKRKKFADQLAHDFGSRTKAGESLLLCLDKLDDTEKPKLIGNIYVACLNGIITFDELRRFTSIVGRAFLPDLKKLAERTSFSSHDVGEWDTFVGFGLLDITAEDHGSFDKKPQPAETRYEVSALGQKFVRHALRLELPK